MTDAASLAALLALSDALGLGRALGAPQVAAAAGVTASYVRSRVLPGLATRGLAVMTAPGRWTAVSPYRSPVSSLVTIEAKLRDWRGGLGHTARHAAGADAAWLVLDGACTGPAAMRADWFRVADVVLAGLGQDGTRQLLLRNAAVSGRIPVNDSAASASKQVEPGTDSGQHGSSGPPGPDRSRPQRAVARAGPLRVLGRRRRADHGRRHAAMQATAA